MPQSESKMIKDESGLSIKFGYLKAWILEHLLGKITLGNESRRIYSAVTTEPEKGTWLLLWEMFTKLSHIGR